MSGWRAHIIDDAWAWSMASTRVTFYRQLGEGAGEQIVDFGNMGIPAVERVEPGAQMRDGFLIPTEALGSLVEQLKPGPSAGEVALLKATLAIEQTRVDRILEDFATLAQNLTDLPSSVTVTHRQEDTLDERRRPPMNPFVGGNQSYLDMMRSMTQAACSAKRPPPVPGRKWVSLTDEQIRYLHAGLERLHGLAEDDAERAMAGSVAEELPVVDR